MILAQQQTTIAARLEGPAAALTPTAVLVGMDGVTVATAAVAEVAGGYTATLTAPVAGVDTAYQLVWSDASFDEDVVEDVIVSPVAQTGVRAMPSLSALGSLMRSRTRERGATKELGHFTPLTRPTGLQAHRLLLQAASTVGGKVGFRVPPLAAGAVRNATMYLAAHLIELSYWPEQLAGGSGLSPAERYLALYEVELASAVDIVADVLADGAIDVDGSSMPRPAYAFPDPRVAGRVELGQPL